MIANTSRCEFSRKFPLLSCSVNQQSVTVALSATVNITGSHDDRVISQRRDLTDLVEFSVYKSISVIHCAGVMHI